MNTHLALVALTSAALLSVAGTAHAGIASVSGQTTLVANPSGSVALGALTGFNAYAWDEQQGVAFTVAVDQTNNGPDSGAIPGILNGAFDSHFLHFEPLPGAINASGSVTFTSGIVGVIFTAPNLDLTDGSLGHVSVSYPTGYPFRGIAGFPPSTINVVGNTIHFNFFSVMPVSSVVQVRVLTEHIPAPGSLALLGLSGLVATRRRAR